MEQRRRVTQADLAARAGVSRSLVSRVVRGLDKVSDDKRERILAAARELGYIDNGIATALAGNRSHHVIGFLPQALENDVFIEVFEGLKAVLDPELYHLVIVEGAMDPVLEDARLRQLVSYAPDCLVVAGYAGSTDALAAAVHAIPIVSVTRRIELDGVHSVYGDDRHGADEATRYLIGLGHTRIAHLQLPPSIPYEERAEGYADAMREAGLEPWLLTPEQPFREEARAVVGRVLDSADRPTAIFCGSDNMALGALEALQERGLSAPDDLSVVGYDNQHAARLVGLTTIDQDARAQGEYAAHRIRRLLGDEEETASAGEAGQVFVPRLVARSTAAPVA